MTRVCCQFLCGVIVKNAEFISKLSEYIRFVFDHEDEFVDFVSSKVNAYYTCEVDRFYMASERCSVFMFDPVSCGHYGTTIKTDDFINWVDKIKNDNNTSS